MLTTAVIAFREFLEAFLIVGVFLGISRKLKLKKELEIGIAAFFGIVISLLLAVLTYVYGDQARNIFSEKNADFLESYLMIFSGVFIAYVVFSLHNVIHKSRANMIIKTHQKLQDKVFDFSIFTTIVFLVIREGFEIALFTASTALFSTFTQNFTGLILGFISASVLGMATFIAYMKLPIGKIFKTTEYAILLLGSSLVQNGITKLFETHFKIYLSNIFSINLGFLPGEETLLGHLIKNIFGIDRNFSFIRLFIMFVYLEIVYLLFIKKRPKPMGPKT